MRFQGKVTLFFTGLFVLLFLQGFFFISHEKSIFHREMEDKGRLLGENLAEISKESIANYQLSRLVNQIESIKAKTDISHISIVNERYMVLADTRPNLEGWIYSGKLVEQTDVRFRRDRMIVRSPIYILENLRGMVEISFTLDALNSKIRENAVIFLLFFIFEVLAAVLFGVFFEIQLVKPLDQLARKVTDITPDSLVEPIRLPDHTSVEIRRVASSIEQMKETLNQAQEEIISKTRMATMGKIAANFAHEIRNPLEAISGSVEILGYDIGEGINREEYLSIIKEEIRNLNDYLENFLEFAKVRPMNRGRVDINGMIRDTLLLLRPLYSKKKIRCNSQLKENLPDCLADAGQLKRVLINVVINSIEALEEITDTEGRRIDIMTDLEAGKIRIDVNDTGPGIGPEKIEKVFDPYFSTKTHGSGIGLSISRKIVEQHEGTIGIESSPGKGTRVTILLPQYMNDEDGNEKHSGS